MSAARIALLAALVLCLAAGLLFRVTRPAYGPVTIDIPGRAPKICAYPYTEKETPRGRFVLRQVITLPALHPTVFQFYPRDFLWGIRVNGHAVDAPALPLSAATREGRAVQLAPYLHAGDNVLELAMESRWGEPGLEMSVAPVDPVTLGVFMLIAMAALGAGWHVASIYGMRTLAPELPILYAGFVLRLFYVLGTPYDVRSFDSWGHADDLDYVTTHGHTPPPDAGWESWQPPLYYLLVGGATRVAEALGVAPESRTAFWQAISLLLSTGVLAVAGVLARQLFPEQRPARLAFLSIFAFAPPLVFNSARVSNDALVALLEFTWLALLLADQFRPRLRTWLGVCLVGALAALTKATALILPPLSFAARVIGGRTATRIVLLRGVALMAIMLAVSGVYYVPRALQAAELNTFVVGNLHRLNHRSHIDGVLGKSLVFNPVELIRRPFNEPWGPRDDYFAEVFFKTMLLGEWLGSRSYVPLGRIFMALALLMAAPCMLGVIETLRRPTPPSRVLLHTLVAVVGAQWLFLQTAPFLATQDFRFSVIVLAPISYYVVRGIECLPLPAAKSTARFALQIMVLNSAVYLILLACG